MEEGSQTTEYCSNCKRDIPSVNYVMHASHCSRNITLCQICDEPVPISEKDEHFEEYHIKVKCACGESIEKMHLEEHKEEDCTSRQVVCEYCELELPFSEMKSHKDFCGSRTTLCDKCNKYIQSKDLEDHLNTDCQSVRPSVQNNAAASNRQHGRNIIPPEERIQNEDLEEGFGFDAVALQRILMATKGSSPGEHDNTGDMDEYETIYSSYDNLFPQPSQDVVARGFDVSQPTRARRNRNNYGFETETVDSDDVSTRNQLEGDELMAALMSSQPDNYNSTQFHGLARDGYHRQNSFDYEAERESELNQTVLPCEFCGELIQAEQLILHQTGCQLMSIGVAMSGTRGFPNLRSLPRSLPPLLHQSLNNEVERNDQIDDHDATMLPCEFCEELINTDQLFNHQSMCDPQRTRPSSVLQAEYFYQNDPELPPPNNSRPRVPTRPPRPSRPVVNNDREDMGFDPPINKEPMSSDISASHRPSPSQRDVRRQTRDRRGISNGSPLTTSNSSSRKQGQRHAHPASEDDDNYEIALPSRGSTVKVDEYADRARSTNYVGVQETHDEKNSESVSDDGRFQLNRVKPISGQAMGVLKPLQETNQPSKYRSKGSLLDKNKATASKTSSTRKKMSSSAGKQTPAPNGASPRTQVSRQQLSRLAPSFDGAKPQSSSDSRQLRMNGNIDKGPNERRGSAERRDPSNSVSSARKSKKKYA